MNSESSTLLARRVLVALLEAGVCDIVVAPGSRNAPLSFAALAAAEEGLVRLHTRIDERSAGFVALGLTRGGSRAAVMCTSGTAVANLHPAMLEAAHSGVRLVAVTADRPAGLRGTDANQTTDQVGIFGPLVSTVDLAAGDPVGEALWGGRGPVHLNVQFAEPLTPPEVWRPGPVRVRPAPVHPEPRILETISADAGTVVIAGDGAGPAARVLAERAGWPLLAEPSSGARSGPNAVRSRRLLLRSRLAARVRRAIVYGAPTLDRETQHLLARPDVEVWSARHDGVWAEHPFAVERRIRSSLAVTGDPDPDWLASWRTTDATLSRQVRSLVGEDFTPQAIAAAVATAAAGRLLVVGASNPIRDLDLMAAPAAGTVLANRGLAGIDGVVSTAIGAALAHGAPAHALMGDVTFVHEAGGLILGPAEPRPDLTIVVVNDNGGSIFATLEQGAVRYADQFERLFGTPHDADLASLCAVSRTPHLAVTSVGELVQALATPNGGIEVIECVVRRDNRRDLDEALNRLAADLV
ncbi:MAG: 2-succinyl-5-enolpyruvyl-6-hydroxy-3-cyclohexene-1-carboxylic-acid synthase [Nocardioides sp.]